MNGHHLVRRMTRRIWSWSDADSDPSDWWCGPGIICSAVGQPRPGFRRVPAQTLLSLCHNRHFACLTTGVDLAGILRGTHGERRRWVGAEWGEVWWAVSPLQPTKGSGGASWASPAGSGAEPRPKTDFGVFWRPQDAPFCIYVTKIWGGQFALVSPLHQIMGGLVLRVPTVIYAHVFHLLTHNANQVLLTVC